MANYTFTDSIPASANYPGNDQPKMLVNNASTKSIIGVDHITFGLNNGGEHNQVTFRDQVSNPTTAAGQMKLWNNGNDLFYRGQNSGTVTALTSGGRPTPVDSWVRFNTQSLAIAQSLNVTSVTYSSGVYTINFTTPLANTTYGVLATGVTAGSGNNPIVFSEFTSGPRTTTTLGMVGQQATSVVTTAATGVLVTVAILGG